MHRDARAPCVGLQHGLPLGSRARWTICRLTYPLKPFLPVVSATSRLREVYDRIWACVKIDENSVSPEGSEFPLADLSLRGFHESRCDPAVPN